MNLINPMNEWSIAIASSKDKDGIDKFNSSYAFEIEDKHEDACKHIIEAIDEIDDIPQVIKDRYKNLLIVDLDSHNDDDYEKIRRMCYRRSSELYEKKARTGNL